jgi:hypothetical protein
VIQDPTFRRGNVTTWTQMTVLLQCVMFVRWEKRQNRRGRLNPDILWIALLCETLRVGGKPRQRRIGCIASIKQSQIDADVVHERCWLFDGVLDRLHQLPDQVNEQDRDRIIACIAKKVPMPSRAEYEFCHRSVRGKFGVTSPLPAHPLYELPANFLDDRPHLSGSSECPTVGKPSQETCPVRATTRSPRPAPSAMQPSKAFPTPGAHSASAAPNLPTPARLTRARHPSRAVNELNEAKPQLLMEKSPPP